MGHLGMLKSFQAAAIVVACVLILSSAESLKCSNDELAACRSQLNTLKPINCKDAIRELPKCLYWAYECQYRHMKGQLSGVVILEKKLNAYHNCARGFKDELCDNERVKTCYTTFDRSAKELCSEAQKLRECINKVDGCHVMRSPFYSLSLGLVHTHLHCFIKNYSVILRAYEKDKQDAEKGTARESPGSKGINFTDVTPITCVDAVPDKSRTATGYKFFGAVFVCSLIALIAIILFIFIRRTGLTVKQRRSLLLAAARLRERRQRASVGNNRSVRTRTSDSQRMHLSSVLDDDMPPPYHIHAFHSCTQYTDLPPPYTSRPSSVNGDFV